MEFEKLKTSNNKYDRLFYDTIEEVFSSLDINSKKKIFFIKLI